MARVWPPAVSPIDPTRVKYAPEGISIGADPPVLFPPGAMPGA
jgi:hypothetical protein